MIGSLGSGIHPFLLKKNASPNRSPRSALRVEVVAVPLELGMFLRLEGSTRPERAERVDSIWEGIDFFWGLVEINISIQNILQ